MALNLISIFKKIQKCGETMKLELTKEEMNLLRFLLIEEANTVSQLIEMEEGKDKEALIKQSNMMNEIVGKIEKEML